jgi:hypothetical protein
MDTQNNIKSIGIKYGGFYAMLYILILVIEESFNLENKVILSIGGIVLSFLIIWQGINEYKSLGDGLIDLSSALKVSLAIGAIGGLGYAVFLYINYSFINPEFIETIREETSNQMQIQRESGQLKTDEEAEMAEKAALMFTSPFVLATIALIGQLFKAFVFGLIIGLISRNKNS